eukprot:3494961-Rhodomonas_salina.1
MHAGDALVQALHAHNSTVNAFVSAVARAREAPESVCAVGKLVAVVLPAQTLVFSLNASHPTVGALQPIHTRARETALRVVARGICGAGKGCDSNLDEMHAVVVVTVTAAHSNVASQSRLNLDLPPR